MRTEYSSPLFHREGSFDYVAKLFDSQENKFYAQFTSAKQSSNMSVRVGAEGGFDTAIMVDQGDDFPIQDFQTPFYREYTPRKRGLVFVIATETLSTDKYGIIADRTPKMIRAINEAMEYDAAEYVSIPTSAAVSTPDGLPLASAAHLLAAGTYSNILSGNPPLSIQSLGDAKTAIFKQPWHTGSPASLVGDYILVVPPELQQVAYELTNTVQDRKPQSGAEAAKNWGGMSVRVVVDPFMTTTTGWALILDGAKNPLKMFNRRGLVTNSFPEGRKDSMAYAANAIWVKAPVDWRGYIFSAGA